MKQFSKRDRTKKGSQPNTCKLALKDTILASTTTGEHKLGIVAKMTRFK